MNIARRDFLKKAAMAAPFVLTARKSAASVLFTASNSQYLTLTTTITDLPVTMAAWVYAADTTAVVACSLYADAANNRRVQLNLDASSLVAASAVDLSGTSSPAMSSTSVSANEWTHACAVFASTTSRTAYKNGVAGTPDTVSITSAPFDRMSIGARKTTSFGAFWDGRIAMIGAWSVALSEPQIQQLAFGASPTKVRPDKLVHFFPMTIRLGSELDYKSGAATTFSGSGSTSTADNPPKLYQ